MVTEFNSKKSDCCGCSSCAQICPKKCIKMTADEEGFLYPTVEKEICINCGLCEKNCPIINTQPKLETVLSAYAGYVNDENIRLNSSSGGLFTPLAEHILNNNGVVFGAAFDNKYHVKHIRIDSEEKLYLLRGSKYVQSDINNTYVETKHDLENGKLVLFTGTACQISGLKCFLNKEYTNLFTVDVLCHGTPSPKLWERYVENQSRQNKSQIEQIFFRHKKYGWKRYAVELKFLNSTAYLKEFKEDPFMRLFLGNICLRPSCYECKFKALQRDSDLTIGDAWGINKVFPELDDDRGTSVILVHSDKGQELLKSISDNLILKEGNVEKLLPPSTDSRISVKKHPKRNLFFKKLNEGKSCDVLLKCFFPKDSQIKILARKIKNKIFRCAPALKLRKTNALKAAKQKKPTNNSNSE